MNAGIISKPVSCDAVDTRVSSDEQAPPASTAAFDEREAWCLDYTGWFIAQLPDEGTPPADVRPTQRFESEFNSCKLNPHEYERLTRTEVREATDGDTHLSLRIPRSSG
jgi:hypothetical protein